VEINTNKPHRDLVSVNLIAGNTELRQLILAHHGAYESKVPRGGHVCFEEAAARR
jgi:hypothetical protein